MLAPQALLIESTNGLVAIKLKRAAEARATPASHMQVGTVFRISQARHINIVMRLPRLDRGTSRPIGFNTMETAMARSSLAMTMLRSGDPGFKDRGVSTPS
jgi:hypothetical protein